MAGEKFNVYVRTGFLISSRKMLGQFSTLDNVNSFLKEYKKRFPEAQVEVCSFLIDPTVDEVLDYKLGSLWDWICCDDTTDKNME